MEKLEETMILVKRSKFNFKHVMELLNKASPDPISSYYDTRRKCKVTKFQAKGRDGMFVYMLEYKDDTALIKME
jgi:hypothetical protein